MKKIIKYRFFIILGIVIFVIIVLASKMDLFENQTMSSRFEVHSSFAPYEGKQTGSNIYDLLQKLIENAKLYCNDPDKIPRVKYITSEDDKSEAKEWQENYNGGKITSKLLKSSNEQSEYVNALRLLRNGISSEHIYFVEFITTDKGLINKINIYYDESDGEYSSNFTKYKGIQTGIKTKQLLEKLIANAKTYKEEPDKIPSVRYVTSYNDSLCAKKWQESSKGGKATSRENDAEWEKKYSKALKKLSKAIKSKHTYIIELNTTDDRFIDEVIIYYNDYNNYNSLGWSLRETNAFNSNFTRYEGKQTGSLLKALCQKLIANAKTYTEEPIKIPRVKYITSEDDYTNAKDWQESDKGGKITSSVLESNPIGQNDYTDALYKLKESISAKHTYFIEFNFIESYTLYEGLVNEVVIYYDGNRDELGIDNEGALAVIKNHDGSESE